MSSEQVDVVVARARAKDTISEPRYHFERHGQEVLVSSLEQCLERLRGHLRRDDLRLFSYLDRTAWGVEAFWAFVAPDNGTIAVYNESRDLIHTFYRPRVPSMRMNAVVRDWIELVRRADGWQIAERWAWRR